jgi:hypothetical protein
MKKLAVLASLVLLFGMGTSAMAEDPPPAPAPVNEVIGNDVVTAGGAAANDGGTAVAVKDNLNGNSLYSGNSSSTTNTASATFSKTKNETKDSYNTNNSVNESTNTFGVSKAAFGSASNVGSGSANVDAEYHVPGEVTSTSSSSNNSKSNADNYNKQEVEAKGTGNAATMTGDATADSRDQSTHTEVVADADDGSIAAINTTGNITLDKSTTITISDIGLAIQNTELKGEVEHNDLSVGGPVAVSVTKSGKTESEDTTSGDARSGATFSGAKSKSGSAALAGARNESGIFTLFTEEPKDEENSSSSASASAESSSGSSADSSAQGGNAQSGNAQSGNAQGGNATGASASASTVFYTGANSFTTGSFNGLGSFNVNSGVNSLQQSPISVNAVVGGNVGGN